MRSLALTLAITMLIGLTAVAVAPALSSDTASRFTALAVYETPAPPPATMPPTPTPASATATPLPTATATPIPSPTATHTPIPTATPPPTPDPARFINGIPFETIAPLTSQTIDTIQDIYARGLTLGRRPNAFSKLGDSGVLIESNLTRFDKGLYDLGPYAFLQPTIDYYAGSYSRYGRAARVSLTAIGANDPMFADPAQCLPNETMLDCEYRLHNPSILLIRLGTNDGNPAIYEQFMRLIVEHAIANGVIPVLGTKADRFEGSDRINDATRRIAAEFNVPLWDFDRLADTLPRRGLAGDDAHLLTYIHNDYTDPETFNRGYPMSDLSTLVVLDAIRQVLATP